MMEQNFKPVNGIKSMVLVGVKYSSKLDWMKDMYNQYPDYFFDKETFTRLTDLLWQKSWELKRNGKTFLDFGNGYIVLLLLEKEAVSPHDTEKDYELNEISAAVYRLLTQHKPKLRIDPPRPRKRPRKKPSSIQMSIIIVIVFIVSLVVWLFVTR